MGFELQPQAAYHMALLGHWGDCKIVVDGGGSMKEKERKERISDRKIGRFPDD